MESALRLFFFALFGGLAGFVLLIIVALVWYRRQPRKAKEPVEDPPELLPLARTGLAPAEPWPPQEPGAHPAVIAFQGLVGELVAGGLAFSAPAISAGGLSSSAGPWELCLLPPAENGQGWDLVLQRTGNRPLADTPPTREILTQLQQQLASMPDFGQVTWGRRLQ